MTEFEIKLQGLFKEATSNFFPGEINNILMGISERNLSGRLALYLDRLLEKYSLNEYFADPEYNRKQDGKIKTILDDEMNVVTINCDVIVHSRGENSERDNLIAIEMKKSTRPQEKKDSDRKRLRALTKDTYDDIWSYDGVVHPEHVCGYIMGIYMEINIEARNCLFEYYKKGTKKTDWIAKL